MYKFPRTNRFELLIGSQIADDLVAKSLEKTVLPMLVYPINVLRNAARKGAGTGLHIVADMENIFSRNFANLSRPLANKMLRIDEPKSVLVYR